MLPPSYLELTPFATAHYRSRKNVLSSSYPVRGHLLADHALHLLRMRLALLPCPVRLMRLLLLLLLLQRLWVRVEVLEVLAHKVDI